MRHHGSNSCYSAGCRCRPCKDAHNAYGRKQRMGIALRVPATDYGKRIRALTQPEMTLAELSAKSGIAERTLRGIRDGNAHCHIATATKLEPWLQTRAETEARSELLRPIESEVSA